MATNTKEGATADFCRALECPVCFDVMRAPILQCVQGHSLCSICRQKLEKCPLCKDCFSGSRNFSLEVVAQSVTSLPCNNFEYGCKKIICLAEQKNHEAVCPYRQYECLPGKYDGNCTWKGKRSDILRHVIKKHPDRVWENGENLNLGAHNDFSCDETGVNLISRYGEIFWVKVRRVPEWRYVSVHYIGREKNCSKFDYEVAYVSTLTTHKIIFRIHTHSDHEDIGELIKKHQCSSIHKDMAQHFVVNDYICYSVKIYRV